MYISPAYIGEDGGIEKVGSLLIRKLKNLDLTIVKHIASDFSTLPQTQYSFTGLKAVHLLDG